MNTQSNTVDGIDNMAAWNTGQFVDQLPISGKTLDAFRPAIEYVRGLDAQNPLLAVAVADFYKAITLIGTMVKIAH